MIPLSTDPVKSLRRWTAVFGTLLALVVVTCAGLYTWGMQRKVARLEAQDRANTADVIAGEVYRQGVATVNTQREEAKDATSEALNRNPEYRDATVPSDVADQLRNRTHSK